MGLPHLIHGAQVKNLWSEPHNPLAALQTQVAPHSHRKEEKGMVCVKHMTAHPRNSASLKALIQTIKSVRIVTEILASLQEYLRFTYLG